MITRRKMFLAIGAGVLAAPFPGFAQQSRIARVGYLGPTSDKVIE